MFKKRLSLTSLSLVCLSVQAATSPIGYPQLNPQNQHHFYDNQHRLDTDGSTVLGINSSGSDLAALGLQVTPSFTLNDADGELQGFKSWGIGGGGAMAGYSINPFDQDMRFVGTDIGTAFRSLNKGVNWSPIRHTQTTFHYNLGYATGFGFAGAKTILHAPQGLNPVRSINAGQTFAAPASFALVYSDDGEHLNDERIVGWYSDTVNIGTIYAMTNLGLWRSTDEGDHWRFVYNGGGIKGLFIDNYESGKVYIATEDQILWSTDGISFSNHHTPSGHKIHRFSGGSNAIAK
ncbi:MAG: hypothetical protein ACI8WB_004211, partial [Phenylobacterium sp.]